MEAIKVTVDGHNVCEIKAFLSRFRDDEYTFTYLLDKTTFIAVFYGDCDYEYFKVRMEKEFGDEVTVVNLKEAGVWN